MSFGGPFVLISNAFSNIVRAEGKSAEAMMGQLLGNLLNVILDPIMILLLGWNITGAAIATLIGNVVGACYYILYFVRGKSTLSVNVKELSQPEKVCGPVCAIGIPAALGSVLMSVSQIIINSQLAKYGDMAVAMKVVTITGMVCMGLGQGVQPLLGYCVGAKLWERFKQASTVINRRHQDYFDGIKAEQVGNLERKTGLCEQIEAMVASELKTHKAWNKASERLLEIQKEWKTIGFAPKKDNTKVYERFRAACDKFFERKRAFYADVKDEMTKNLRLKEELCEAAEKLQESEDWKKATDELLALQAKWKEIGAVSRRHSDAVWKRFRAACDKFFERKSAHFATRESEYAENLRRKSELIEQMLVADVKEGGYEMIKEFQRRWNEIGYVPIKHKDELQKRYKEAVDRLFGVLRGSDRVQSMERFKDKVASLRSAGDKRLHSERERLYNRVRQLEQEIALLENNIGFFAKSKGAEALIAGVKDKIERAKREMAEAIDKVKMIDGEQ